MQVQCIQLAQWMSGFAASIIAGTSILVPTFAVQTADDTAEQPKEKKHKIVRRVEVNDKMTGELDELLKKYNIEMSDSNGVQSFSFSDDSTNAEVIIIDQEMLDGTVLMADSLMRMHMPHFDSAMSNHSFSFKRFGKDFRKQWKPQMDSMMKNQEFIFKNFNGMMDSTLQNFKFDFKMMDSSMKHFKFDFKMLDSELENVDSELENLDSELEKMEIEIESNQEEIGLTAPNGANPGKNGIITTFPRHKNVRMINGKSPKRNGRTRIMVMNNHCGDSATICKKRIIINGDMPMPPDAPIPPIPSFGAVPNVPSVPPLPRIAPLPRMAKNTKVVIITKKDSKKEAKEEPHIAAAHEETPTDRGRYLPENYTEANPWNLALSPNPTTGVVKLSCEMPLKDIPVNLGIYDLQGNQVFLKEGISPTEFQNMQLDLSGNATGTYLIQIAQGDRTFTTKFEISK